MILYDCLVPILSPHLLFLLNSFNIFVNVPLGLPHGRHFLVIPVEHIPTVNDLQKRDEDYSLVNHMLNVGKTLLHQDAPQSKQYRFGFHQPPFNSVDHLHLHCLALPFIPKWKHVKYMSLGHHGFIEAEQLLEKIKPSQAFTP